ncbi:hypothetical protein B0H10DRAFT_2047340 [Mycena sp. CBHHK59/15]|nr:hypothetical protein B0H10DRAFT_2047340 [Mycena sp. CBHHK59/15]
MSAPISLAARQSLIPLDNLLGPWLIGLLISSVIFGITCFQVYLYYTKFCSRDSTFLKIFVGCLLTVEILHLTLLGMSYYEASVTNFGDYVAIFKGPWSLRAQIVVGVFLGTLVQMFYAFRIWTLAHKSPYMPLLIIICSLGALSMSIVYTIKVSITKAFDNTGDVIPFSTSSLSLEVACDALITGAMVYNLWKGHTDYHRTNRALNILIAYTINSGAITTVFAICTLVLFLTSKVTLIYSFFFFILVRLYGCSFMSILNSREYIRKQLNHEMVTIPTNTSRTVQTADHKQTNGLDSLGTVVFARNNQQASTLSTV